MNKIEYDVMIEDAGGEEAHSIHTTNPGKALKFLARYDLEGDHVVLGVIMSEDDYRFYEGEKVYTYLEARN